MISVMYPYSNINSGYSLLRNSKLSRIWIENSYFFEIKMVLFLHLLNLQMIRARYLSLITFAQKWTKVEFNILAIGFPTGFT